MFKSSDLCNYYSIMDVKILMKSTVIDRVSETFQDSDANFIDEISRWIHSANYQCRIRCNNHLMNSKRCKPVSSAFIRHFSCRRVIAPWINHLNERWNGTFVHPWIRKAEEIERAVPHLLFNEEMIRQSGNRRRLQLMIFQSEEVHTDLHFILIVSPSHSGLLK